MITGTLYTIFTASIIIFLIGEGIILLGNKNKRRVAWTMIIIGIIGFIYSFFNMVK